jgi:hypothetical protein
MQGRVSISVCPHMQAGSGGLDAAVLYDVGITGLNHTCSVLEMLRIEADNCIELAPVKPSFPGLSTSTGRYQHKSIPQRARPTLSTTRRLLGELRACDDDSILFF